MGITALKWMDFYEYENSEVGIYIKRSGIISESERRKYKDIFLKATEFDPRKRCTIGELITALEYNYDNTNFIGTLAEEKGSLLDTPPPLEALPPIALGGNLSGSRKTTVNRPSDSCSKAKANAKSKGPQPTDERVVFAGRNHVVYMGPRGGRYVKSKGKLVRL